MTPWLLPDGCLHRFETKFDKFIDVVARWSDISPQRYLYKGCWSLTFSSGFYSTPLALSRWLSVVVSSHVVV